MKNTEKHCLGEYIVSHGSIVNKSSNAIIENPALVIDKATGGVLKRGNKEPVARYFEKLVNKIPEYAEDYLLLEFDRFSGLFDTEEICTVLNYLCNCHDAEIFNKVMTMDIAVLKNKISKWTECGW